MFIHMYLYMYSEKLINQVIKDEVLNVKVCRCYNVSVLMNHHQD